MHKTNLFELLGSPVKDVSPHSGTVHTAAPRGETFDDDGSLPSMADYGTYNTRRDYETYDDDGVLPSIADIGTIETRSNYETYDDDGLLPNL
ncbi:MAG: hypothetical protein OXT07_03970 [bacterium]|nr:hypothetical protein [bacterium]